MAYVKMTASARTAALRVAETGRTAMDPDRKLALFEQNVMPHLHVAYNLALVDPQRP
jgi:hypothetical protein